MERSVPLPLFAVPYPPATPSQILTDALAYVDRFGVPVAPLTHSAAFHEFGPRPHPLGQRSDYAVTPEVVRAAFERVRPESLRGVVAPAGLSFDVLTVYPACGGEVDGQVLPLLGAAVYLAAANSLAVQLYVPVGTLNEANRDGVPLPRSGDVPWRYSTVGRSVALPPSFGGRWLLPLRSVSARRRVQIDDSGVRC